MITIKRNFPIRVGILKVVNEVFGEWASVIVVVVFESKGKEIMISTVLGEG